MARRAFAGHTLSPCSLISVIRMLTSVEKRPFDNFQRRSCSSAALVATDGACAGKRCHLGHLGGLGMRAKVSRWTEKGWRVVLDALEALNDIITSSQIGRARLSRGALLEVHCCAGMGCHRARSGSACRLECEASHSLECSGASLSLVCAWRGWPSSRTT